MTSRSLRRRVGTVNNIRPGQSQVGPNRRFTIIKTAPSVQDAPARLLGPQTPDSTPVCRLKYLQSLGRYPVFCIGGKRASTAAPALALGTAVCISRTTIDQPDAGKSCGIGCRICSRDSLVRSLLAPYCMWNNRRRQDQNRPRLARLHRRTFQFVNQSAGCGSAQAVRAA